MISQQKIRQQVRDILCRIVPGIDPGISDEDDIFSAGIDSVSTMMLITELEQNFSISLDGEDIPYENFRTVTGIASFIETKSK